MAGVTKPTLYYYFGSKRGLLEAILEAKSGKLHRSIEEETGKAGDVRANCTLWRKCSAAFSWRRESFTCC